MIEGLFFVLQLLAMWLLVRAVSGARQTDRSEDLGLYEYKADKSERADRGERARVSATATEKKERRA
jgi:hypothetical protein